MCCISQMEVLIQIDFCVAFASNMSDIIAADDEESNDDDAAVSRNCYGFHPFLPDTAS